jgi:predicted nucleic acid-binding protein
LNLLHRIGDRIVVPGAVAEEVTAHSDEAARALREQDWLKVVSQPVVPPLIASWDLGDGESAVLSWALAHPGALAIIDDYAARTCARVLGMPLVGTLGLALRAKMAGDVASARSLIDELRRAGLYLSDPIVREALAVVEE